MKLGAVTLQKKTRCTACKKMLVDGTSVQVVLNYKGKVKEYRCLTCELKHGEEK